MFKRNDNEKLSSRSNNDSYRAVIKQNQMNGSSHGHVPSSASNARNRSVGSAVLRAPIQSSLTREKTNLRFNENNNNNNNKNDRLINPSPSSSSSSSSSSSPSKMVNSSSSSLNSNSKQRRALARERWTILKKVFLFVLLIFKIIFKMLKI